MGEALLMNHKRKIKKDGFGFYGVKIDTTNSNTESALKYIGDSKNFTPAKMNFTTDTFEYGSWEDKFPFNQIKPCLLKDGEVNYYLDPNDYTKKLDGTAADITSGSDGDVMVEFPKIYWKFETIGTDLYIRYSNYKVDEGYKCLAHMKGNEEEKVYISAYLGFKDSSDKLRSLSGKTPTTNRKLSVFRGFAQANGEKYNQLAYSQLLMLQVLYLIMFKDRNSQVALGRGYVDGNSSAITTGSTDAKGLFYGESKGKKQIKFCGIEDFYGNVTYFIEGLYIDANYNILIGNHNFNDTGVSYVNYGADLIANTSGYIDSISGKTETGFLLKSKNGSSSTHWADSGNISASAIGNFGGSWTHADNAGTFRLNASVPTSFASSAIGSRIFAL